MDSKYFRIVGYEQPGCREIINDPYGFLRFIYGSELVEHVQCKGHRQEQVSLFRIRQEQEVLGYNGPHTGRNHNYGSVRRGSVQDRASAMADVGMDIAAHLAGCGGKRNLLSDQSKEVERFDEAYIKSRVAD